MLTEMVGFLISGVTFINRRLFPVLALSTLWLAVPVFTNAAIDASDVTPKSSSKGSSADGITLKRKIAIARFTNETQSNTSFLMTDQNDRVGKQASDILSAKLSASGQFLLFERIDAEKTTAEQMLAGIEAEGVGVDYLILGSVSEFGRSTESTSGVFSRAKQQKAYAKVNVRLIDVSTGRVIHSAEGAGDAVSTTKTTMGLGSRSGFDQSLTDKAIAAAIAQVTGKLIQTMTAAPWRSYLLSFEDGSYFIAGGSSQGLKPGLRLVVYKKGKQVKNPQTGALIELPGKVAAQIQIQSTFGDDEFNEISLASIVSGVISTDLNEYYVEEA